MKGTLLVKNVKHLVTCDGDDRLLDGVDVFIRDGVIAGIGQEAGTLESGTLESGTAEDVIDASNMVIYPGLINTHHHFYQTFSRNLPRYRTKIYQSFQYIRGRAYRGAPFWRVRKNHGSHAFSQYFQTY